MKYVLPHWAQNVERTFGICTDVLYYNEYISFYSSHLISWMGCGSWFYLLYIENFYTMCSSYWIWYYISFILNLVLFYESTQILLRLLFLRNLMMRLVLSVPVILISINGGHVVFRNSIKYNQLSTRLKSLLQVSGDRLAWLENIYKIIASIHGYNGAKLLK